MTQQQEKVTITLTDVASLVQIIDATSQRGAFQGQEMAGVGMLRNRLEMYLQQNGAAEMKGEELAQTEAEIEAAPSKGELAGKVVK